MISHMIILIINKKYYVQLSKKKAYQLIIKHDQTYKWTNLKMK
jgi:hypothetical protein